VREATVRPPCSAAASAAVPAAVPAAAQQGGRERGSQGTVTVSSWLTELGRVCRDDMMTACVDVHSRVIQVPSSQ